MKKSWKCFFGFHKDSKFIKAKDYKPPQLFVAGCYVCERCGRQRWI